MIQLKCYLAAPWTCKIQARAAKKELEDAGFIVTSRWIDLHEPIDKSDPAYSTYLEEQAIHDVKDVFAADVLVLLNLEISEGKSVETGLCLAEGIPIILVGERSNIFHWLPLINRVDNLRIAIAILKKWEENINSVMSQAGFIPEAFLEGEIISPPKKE